MEVGGSCFSRMEMEVGGSSFTQVVRVPVPVIGTQSMTREYQSF